MAFKDFCEFDYFFMLKKFNKSLSESNINQISSFDKIIVYYDNGQQELNLVLNTIFSLLLSNVEFRKASPLQYRLLQLADFVCSVELLAIKLSEKRLSKSETGFFYKPQELKKSFVRAIRTKELL